MNENPGARKKKENEKDKTPLFFLRRFPAVCSRYSNDFVTSDNVLIG